MSTAATSAIMRTATTTHPQAGTRAIVATACSRPTRPFVDRLDPGRHDVPGKLACALASGTRQLSGERRLAQYTRDRRRDRFVVGRRCEQPIDAIVDHL